MIELAVVIIGKICSGKSTLAKALAVDNSFTIVSFGAFVKHLCVEKGIEPTRKNKQNLGEKLVRENPSFFLLKATEFSLKANSTMPVIYEGVRHVSILQAIREISKKTHVIYLDYDVDVRYSRYLLREKLIDTLDNRNFFLEKSNHPVEQEITELLPIADHKTSIKDPDSLVKSVTIDLYKTIY